MHDLGKAFGLTEDANCPDPTVEVADQEPDPRADPSA
jgi:hypothetical protein